MEQKKLFELTVNDVFEGYVLIRSFNVKTGQNSKNYIDLTITDAYSEMNAKIWEYNEEKYGQYKPNSLIKIRGNVVLWQTSLQLRIEKIRLADATDPVHIEEFVPSAPLTGEEMLAMLQSFANRIIQKDINQIVNNLVNKYKERLLYWPAAQANHHSIRGGLLYHTTTMLRSAEALSAIYTQLNTDYLYAGVILHDLEKINEMDASELGMVSDYTRNGLLLGHIVQGTLSIAEAGKEVGAGEQTIVLLQHMLISHHYEPEFGAIRRPMFPEAEMLHYLDMIDARMFDFSKALSEVQEGGFSDKQWLLHNRRLYKMVSEKEE